MLFEVGDGRPVGIRGGAAEFAWVCQVWKVLTTHDSRVGHILLILTRSVEATGVRLGLQLWLGN
jgi:hypothetical protein